jgi:hypothetical protein
LEHGLNGTGRPFWLNSHISPVNSQPDQAFLEHGNFYDKIVMSEEGLAWLSQPGLMWESATTQQRKGSRQKIEEYIQVVFEGLKKAEPTTADKNSSCTTLPTPTVGRNCNNFERVMGAAP